MLLSTKSISLPLEIGRAVLVDVDLDALRVEHVVIRGRLVFPAELVGHPGAASAHHADPQTPLGLAFLEAELGDLLRGRFGHRNHAYPPGLMSVSGIECHFDCVKCVSQDAARGQQGELLERGARRAARPSAPRPGPRPPAGASGCGPGGSRDRIPEGRVDGARAPAPRRARRSARSSSASTRLKPDHAGLRRRVDGGARKRPLGGDRGDVDDRARGAGGSSSAARRGSTPSRRADSRPACASQSPGLVPTTGPKEATPAAVTRTSTRPSSATACSTSASTARVLGDVGGDGERRAAALANRRGRRAASSCAGPRGQHDGRRPRAPAPARRRGRSRGPRR